MVAQPYRLPLVYQEGARLGVYPNEEWAEQPGDMVTRAVSDAIMATGRFQDVGNAADMARPDLILTGELRKFHEERSDTSLQAVISLHLELREARGTNAYWVETLTVYPCHRGRYPHCLCRGDERCSRSAHSTCSGEIEHAYFLTD